VAIEGSLMPQARTQPLAQALKQAPRGMKKARQGLYDPVPDLLRLERGASTSLGARNACNHIQVMLRRDSDFESVANAFR